MDAAWHLIQYTADMRRKEPRNIGVAVSVDDQWAIKLFAVDQSSGRINGRALKKYGLTKDGYEAWVEYFTDMILSGRWERVLQAQRRRPSEFRLVTGGHTRAAGTARDVATRLFAELVHREEGHVEPRARVLQQRVEQTLRLAEVEPQADIVVPALWDDAADDVEFDYAYTNGRRHLMERLQLHQTSIDTSKMVAREFNARVTAASAAGAAESFIAFYSGEAVEEMGGDSMLTPIFKVAEIVDVDNEATAAENLLAIMHRTA
ncbi:MULTISPECIES: hypothetical protein [Rhodococcus]|uniref:hypothetical protein n=1 Tax=Rhodococcus TaxID=1827 RepID=UPI00143E6DEF|nr:MULTISPECIES: hypothetical protein [Rhodococcus]QIX48903.1 hypothetical protein HFP48_04600 [Rhodococcus sp. DMU1]QRI76047.1 hypothetical protein JQ505_26830 [Rhodococcus aetherivorans]QSE59458.1 hypothetical protein JYA75_27930 [Rhodococcus sp. PSBB066]QSE69217.1 hypothetical protein JYA91_27525 [Rhodococcus sp. PSBB049]